MYILKAFMRGTGRGMGMKEKARESGASCHSLILRPSSPLPCYLLRGSQFLWLPPCYQEVGKKQGLPSQTNLSACSRLL